MTTRNDIERVLWKACDSFRGKIDSSRYKDYILSMLFVKYLSDVTKEKHTQYMEQYDGDQRRVERAMSRERFVVDKESSFPTSYEEEKKIGDLFANLDTLITLHQRKFEEEKKKKKALQQLLLTGIVRTN